MWELDLIAMCMVLMAIEPAVKLFRGGRNLYHRWAAHRKWRTEQ